MNKQAKLPVVDGYVLHAAEVPGHPRDVPATRRSVSEALRGTGVDGDTVDTVELLLTELVSDRDLSEAELRRLRELLDQRLEEER